MSRPYRREPECLHCDDVGFVPLTTPEPGSGEPADMTPCICRKHPDPDAAPPVTDDTVRTDLGYAS